MTFLFTYIITPLLVIGLVAGVAWVIWYKIKAYRALYLEAKDHFKN